jgi:hypothetical protein
MRYLAVPPKGKNKRTKEQKNENKNWRFDDRQQSRSASPALDRVGEPSITRVPLDKTARRVQSDIGVWVQL